MQVTFSPASELMPEHLVNAFNASYEGYIIPLKLDQQQMAHHISANDINLGASRVAWLDGEIVGVGLLGQRGVTGWIGGVGRIRFPRRRQDELHTWAFAQLRALIAYKAERSGVPVIAVDARYTSQQCCQCGHTSRANRPHQATFNCQSCGFVSHADWNAARNIAGRAAVNPPYAVCVLGLTPATTASSPL